MKTRVGDIDLHYTIEGKSDCPWITLSHSLACDLSAWDEQAALLARDFRVLRFDTRGHGQSSAPAGPYSLEQLADDVYGLFKALGITSTHWMGISMGGMIGQAFALKYPGVFKSLILVDTTSRRPPNAEAMWGDRINAAQAQGMAGVADSTITRWFTEPFRLKHPDTTARVKAGILATPVAGFCGCCAAIAKVDYLDRLHEITCPALVMVGDQDHGTPPAMAEQIHAHLAGSQYVLIKDAAHITNIEQPEIFNRHMLAFLSHL